MWSHIQKILKSLSVRANKLIQEVSGYKINIQKSAALITQIAIICKRNQENQSQSSYKTNKICKNKFKPTGEGSHH
jgi:hypothetical protein